MRSATTALSFFSVWLISIAISAVAQPAVLDVDGKPLETGVEYYILPGITDVAGGLTLIDRNDMCPLYVGQESITALTPETSQGTSVTFKPYADGETIVRESRDLTITFQAFTICIQSTAWRVGERDPETGRRFILTGGEASYFVIEKNGGDYIFRYCPTESCPLCKPRCGSAGILIENGKRLLALDGPTTFPFRFKRA